MSYECEMIKEGILETTFDNYRYVRNEELMDGEVEELVESLCGAGCDCYWITEVEELNDEEVEYYVIIKK